MEELIEEKYEFIGPPSLLKKDITCQSYLVDAYDKVLRRDCTLKLWKKTGTALDNELKRLWRQEMRQVQRLSSHTGSSQFFVEFNDFVEDTEKFGSVFSFAGRPLSILEPTLPSTHWLRNLQRPRPRRQFWLNILRVVSALRILYAFGIVHGNLDEESLISEGTEEADFRLIGFEWSMHIRDEVKNVNGADLPLNQPVSGGAQNRVFSFAGDWNALGIFIAKYLGIEFSAEGAVLDNESSITISEERLLRRLISPSNLDSLEHTSVYVAIQDLIRKSKDSLTIGSGEFLLYIPFNERMEKTLYKATDSVLATDDRVGQLDLIETDLDGTKTLLVSQESDGSPQRLRIISDTFIYTIKPFHGDMGLEWDIGVCSDISLRKQHLRFPDDQAHDMSEPIYVTSSRKDVIERRALSGLDAFDWGAFQNSVMETTHQDSLNIILSLYLVELVSSVLTSLEIIPVSIISKKYFKGQYFVQLSPQDSSEQDILVTKLGLKKYIDLMRSLFEEEQRDPSGAWFLSESRSLGNAGISRVELKFTRTTRNHGHSIYEFESEEELDETRNWYLRNANNEGNSRVIRRRLNNISSMNTRQDLLDMLEDPWICRKNSRDILDKSDQFFLDLDRPKQAAFDGLWSTVPSYFIVGPPGVGKTKLASEVVRRKCDTDINSRILISAQGHEALDNLQEKIKASIVESGREDIIIVRSDTPDNREPTGFESRDLAWEIIDSLKNSNGYRSAPNFIKQKLSLLQFDPKQCQTRAALNHEEIRLLNAFSSLLMDAADIVVATANSFDIEKMVEEHQQFDWVIIEEAAKATGPELIGPLMLSGRRLLIGDHAQLPPFDCDRVQEVLTNSEKVKDILRSAKLLVGGIFNDDEFYQLDVLMKDTDLFEQTIGNSLRLLEPFKTFVTQDAEKTIVHRNHRPISSELNEQRRMDPAIAGIISKAFYDKKLVTSAERNIEAEQKPPPYRLLKPLLPSPVVMVDHPHVNKTGKPETIEKDKPRRWNNPLEIDSIIQVLKLIAIEPTLGARPSLAILTPYAEQVVQIKNRIESLIDTELAHIKHFDNFGEKLVGTVDSFQGREADIVIISMVRNNPRTGFGALGFLRDRRRVNVLLSRAKHQLILIGSLDFLHEAVLGVNPKNEPSHKLYFLSSIVNSIRALSTQYRSNNIPLAQILPAKHLSGSVR